MKRFKSIMGYIFLVILFYSLSLFCQVILFATFDGFSNASLIYSEMGEKMIFIILGIYMLLIIGLFLLVLFAKRKAKVKVYGLKTSLIFILCFLVGYFAVPLAFQDMTEKIAVQLIVFIRDYGWITYEIP